MAGSLQLEVFYSGEPAFCVPEYAELELRLTNNSQLKLSNGQVKTGLQAVKAGLNLAPATTWIFPYNVTDLVGDLSFEATATNNSNQLYTTQCCIQVIPQKIDLAELLFIKTERLPTLLARLDAPNRLQLAYHNDQDKPFDFYSLEYTAEKLEFFSKQLLEQGLSAAILERMDYAMSEQLQGGTDIIRGSLKWPTTLQNWFNHPELSGYYHAWTNSSKFYGTPANLLFCQFQTEISREFGRLASLVEAARPKLPRLHARLPLFLRRSQQHWQLIQNSPLAQFQKATDFPFIQTAELGELERTCRQPANTAYLALFKLWRDFRNRYVNLPDEASTNVAATSLLPVSKIYELWAVCEIAAAFNLKYEGNPNGQSSLTAADFCFKGETNLGKVRLYYNRALQGGWYSASRTGLPRPDIRLEIGEPLPRQVLFDVKYRVAQQENGATRAKPEDMYKMLAYMSDFEADTGAIIYPGQAGQISCLTISNQKANYKQRLIELTLRPLLIEPQTTSEVLRSQLEAVISG